jgi:hypothetical protein
VLFQNENKKLIRASSLVEAEKQDAIQTSDN